MPELPEVETIRLQLDKILTGLRVVGVEVLNKKSFLGEIGKIKGKRVIGVTRRAKITLIELENGVYLAIHLKLTGQLIYREGNMQPFGDAQDKNTERSVKYCEQKNGPFAVCELPNKYTRVIINFDNGSSPCLPAGRLFFNDLRMFGWIRVIRDLRELGEEKFGPEANDEKKFTLEYFKNILAKTKKPIKIVIMDQEKLAGVGNIYANEALFSAGIMPTRPANSLSEKEAEKLRDWIIKVLKEAIKHKGSSDRDEAYRQISGERGTHQNYLQVYGKAGQKCPSCSSTIKRITVGGRGTFICQSCQK